MFFILNANTDPGETGEKRQLELESSETDLFDRFIDRERFLCFKQFLSISSLEIVASK